MKLKSLVFVFALFASVPAFAQSFDLSGGFQFMRDQEIEENFPGWFAQVGGNVTPTFGIVGEVAGGTKTYTVLGTDLDLTVYSFMGGPRFSGPRSAPVIPFVQVLFGVARASLSAVGESESESEFAIQPAGGVDVMFSPNVGIRGAGFYRRIAMSDGTNEFGFQVGIVLSGGSR
jgi:hypothetical protein